MGGETLEVLRGKALIPAAIAEAEVRAVGTDGRLLAAARLPLDAAGLFSLPAAGLPEDFRVEIEDLAAGEVLRAEVRGYQPGWTLVFVSAVSTLICAYLDRHPESSLAAAAAAVKAFVGIPAGADLAYDLADDRLASFDLAAFQADARARGGVAAQSRELLDRMAAGADRPAFSRAKPRLRAEFGDQLLDSFLGGLATAAAQKVASSLGAPGWMMGLLGAKNEDEIQGGIAEIQNQLRDQKQLIKHVQDQIAELEESVEATKEQLFVAEEKKAYELGAAMALVPLSSIEDIQTSYRHLFEYDLTKPAHVAEAKQTSQRLRGVARTELWISLTQLHDLLAGNVAVEGLLTQWARIMGRGKKGFANGFVDHEVLDDCHQQFGLYAGYQLSALQVLIEAYHAEQPVSSRLAQKAATVLQARLQQQLELVGGPANLDPQLIIHRPTELMWHKKGAPRESNRLPAAFTYSKKNPIGFFRGDGNPIAFVANLRTGRYADWRLPTRQELAELIRDRSGGPGDWLDRQGFALVDKKADPYYSYFLIAPDTVSDPLDYELWDAYTGKIIKVRDFPGEKVPMRVLPVRRVWPQRRAAQLRGVVDGGFRFVAKKIVGAVGSKISGKATGWILRSLGADTSDPVVGGLDQIREDLHEQKMLIEDISFGVRRISRQVDDLRAELLELGENTTYVTLVRHLLLGISEIGAIHELLGWMVEAEPSENNRVDVQALRGLIVGTEGGSTRVSRTLQQIHLALLPARDREGILPLAQRRIARRLLGQWSDSPVKRQQFFTKAFLDVINDQYEFFAMAQTLGLQLAVEAAHANNELVAARNLVADFGKRIHAQEALLIGPRVPDDRFLYNDRSKSHWAKAPIRLDGEAGADCYFEWSPNGGGTFTKGDPRTALENFRRKKPDGPYEVRFLSEADLVGKADLPNAETFRRLFTRVLGFDEAFDLPIWLSLATPTSPLVLIEGFAVEHDPRKTYRFTVLPVLEAIPEPDF